MIFIFNVFVFHFCDFALFDFSTCRIDGAAAIMVLGEAAKHSLATLRVLQNLARGLIPSSIITEDVEEEIRTEGREHTIKPQHQYYATGMFVKSSLLLLFGCVISTFVFYNCN